MTRHVGLRILALVFSLSLLSVSLVNHDALATTSPSEYSDYMSHLATPGVGCFDSTYPSTTWANVTCGSGLEIGPASVGNTYDYSGYAGATTEIGFAEGSFSSASVNSEQDSKVPAQCSGSPCQGFYGLQLNSQVYGCTYASHSAECWQQFIFDNVNGSGNDGELFIQYQLVDNYGGTYGCPSGWYSYSAGSDTDCYTNSDYNYVPFQNPTSELDSLSLSGQANYESSGEDDAAICNATNCYAVSESDTNNNLDLYQYWNTAEFNIFGFDNYSEAVFNPTASMAVNLEEEQGTGSIITPTCNGPSGGGTTGETNSMTLGSGSCGVSGYYEIMSFDEYD